MTDLTSIQYAGNGTDNRNITVLSGFGTPTFVLIKRLAVGLFGSFNVVGRTDTMGAGDLSKDMANAQAIAGTTNLIQALGAVADTFQVGSDDQVNHSSGATVGYTVICCNAGTAGFATFSYTGNGSSPRSVGSFGFTPVLAVVMPANAAVAMYKTSAHAGTASWAFLNAASITTGITALGVGSITVGSTLNANGIVYHVAVFDATQVEVIAYTGTSAVRRIAHDRGQAPQYIWAHSIDSTNLQVTQTKRPIGSPATGDAPWNGNSTTGAISSADASAVTLGLDPSVNSTGKAYELMVFGPKLSTQTALRQRALTGVGL